ncbi:MAG: ExbD/TolR family protein [Chitinivibrionales bacterium]
MKCCAGKFFTRESENTGAFRPQLTSLIDVMTILLVFLIKSFSVEGNLISPPEDLELPVSKSDKKAEPRLSLTVTKSAILHEERTLTQDKDFAESDSVLIPSLAEWIQEKGFSRDKTVIIEADKRLEFRILKRVMYTLSKSGLEDFQILAIRKE